MPASRKPRLLIATCRLAPLDLARLETVWLPLLPARQRGRYAALANPGRRREWLAGRALLGELWRQAVDTNRAFVPDTLPDGRPAAPPGWHASISHSDGLAVAALATLPVGVDVQGHRPRSYRAFAARLAAPERRGIGDPDAPEAQAQLRLLWTLKEAAAKSVGATVRDGMRWIQFQWRDSFPAAPRMEPPLPTAGWHFWCARLHADWDCAIALQGTLHAPCSPESRTADATLSLHTEPVSWLQLPG